MEQTSNDCMEDYQLLLWKSFFVFLTAPGSKVSDGHLSEQQSYIEVKK